MGLLLSCLHRTRLDSSARLKMCAYRKEHRLILLKNALPVFVAASISRAILSIILTLSGRMSAVLAAFLYTFVLSHSTGVLLSAYLPDGFFMEDYFHSLITETVGFAWKESALLLVVEQVAYHNTIGAGIGTWFGFVAFSICFVSVSTLLCIRLSLTNHAERAVATFTSEVFALSIAYTLTVIIAYLVYWRQKEDSSIYATDDAEAGDDDTENSEYTKLSHGLFFCYAVALTYVIALIQAYNENKYSVSTPGPSDLSVEQIADDSTDDPDRLDHSQDEQRASTEFSKSGAVLARYVTWNDYFHVHSALTHLLQTFQGYLVGSAWFLWATYTFEVLFSFSEYLTVLAYTLFAVWMTYLMAKFMSLSRLKLENLWSTCDVGSMAFVRRRKRQQLKMAASRITVGWIWEAVVAEAFIQIAGVGKHELTDDLKLLVKCGVAVFVFVFGIVAQYYIFQHVEDHHETNQLSEPILRHNSVRENMDDEYLNDDAVDNRNS